MLGSLFTPPALAVVCVTFYIMGVVSEMLSLVPVE